MKEINFFLNPPFFLFPWQLQQSLSYQLRFFFFHCSVWQLLGVEQIQNGGRCHGNQGAKNVKFTSNFTNFAGNVSCHIHI
jgi:hypothetical protein